MEHSPAFLRLVEDAKARVRETDVATVHARRERGERFHLVDVREDLEWAAGHIRGAVHLGRGIIERDIERVIPDTAAEIVLYCGGGYRSVLVAESLQKMGYANVVSMNGGWRGWKEAGLDTTGTK
ncbi:MAG TPA: rhodanese-like domain-containing protein [Longimicrobiales bacterium]|nr:rhodanese-like domain-containing protein [Longimicrobiales bacterium]